MARDEKRRGGGRRVVLFPCPLQGHLNPMLHLATLLHSQGFAISIVHTRLNAPNPCNFRDFAFEAIDDGVADEHAQTEDLMGLVGALNVRCLQPFRERVVQMLAEHPVACIISDALMHFTQSVAEELKLPRIIFRTSSVTSFLVCSAFPVLRQKGYLPIQDPQSEALISDMAPLRVKDLPHFGTDKLDNMYQLVSSMIKEIKTSSAVISNSCNYLEPSPLEKIREKFPMPIFLVGPLHKHAANTTSSALLQSQYESCMAWLQDQSPESVLYVSLGSLVVMDRDEMAEMAWGLANCGQPFLWVVRPGLVRGADRFELPEELEEIVMERGRVVPWAAQTEVLGHPSVGGFLTHSGWNSTLESVSAGVPMLCWPCFGDQRVNARYVCHVWKVGLQIEGGLDRVKIENGIRKLMGEEGKETRQRAKLLKTHVEASILEGGSSYESLQSLIDLIISL